MFRKMMIELRGMVTFPIAMVFLLIALDVFMTMRAIQTRAYAQNSNIADVSTTPVNIVTTAACRSVTIRENASSGVDSTPYIVVDTTKGSSDGVTIPAGQSYTFFAPTGLQFPSGTTLGTVATVTGTTTFVIVQSNADSVTLRGASFMSPSGASGGGNVTGPVSSTANDFSIFSDTSGKVLSDLSTFQVDPSTGFITKVDNLSFATQNGSLPYPAVTCAINAASQTSGVTAGTTICTVPATNSAYDIKMTVTCDTAVASATVIGNFNFTDVSNTTETQSIGTATCTTLGTGSMKSASTFVRIKGGTPVTYGVSITNSPTYDVSVIVNRESAQ